MTASPEPDPLTGFCRETKTYHSVRSAPPLPDPQLPLLLPDFIFSLLRQNHREKESGIIDAVSGNNIPYTHLEHRVHSVAGFLSGIIGIKKDDAVLIISPNCIQVPVVALAVLSIGAVLTASNPAATVSDVSSQTLLSNPVLAVVHSSAVHLAPPNLCHPPIIIDSPEFHDVLISDKQHFKPVRSLGLQSHTATILYSSGTTGRFKGVVSTHRNFIALMAILDGTRNDELQGGATLITPPMFHIMGFFMVMNGIAKGETLVFMNRFDLGRMFRTVQKYRIQNIPVSPPVMVAMAKSDEVDSYDLSSLKTVGCGGAALGKGVIDRFAARFPNVSVVQGYGLTESTGVVARTTEPEETLHYGSTGRLLPHVEARIVDVETGTCLPPGMQGELWLRGPTIMKGYVDNEEATASSFDTDGWLKTGDLCYFDMDGYLFIVDRLKELIKYKGYQVAPVELEQILQSHPEILDAAVIPYPDEEVGQIPMAFVVRRPDSSINDSQVMNIVAAQVAPYKKIRRVAFVNSIPKTAAGKILRKDLIQQSLRGSHSRL